MQNRYASWCSWWDKKLGEIENSFFKEITTDKKLEIFQAHSGPGALNSFSRYSRGLSTRKCLGFVPIIIAIGWLLVFFLAIYYTIIEPNKSIEIPYDIFLVYPADLVFVLQY